MSNSKRKCKECGEYFPALEMVKVPAGVFCCIEHASEWAVKARQKAQDKIKRKKASDDKAEKKASRERDLERLKSVQNISFFHKKAQAAFNAFIRERDKGNPCISCGKPDNGQHQRHASHYRSVGACSSLRYDESNVHVACATCNTYLSGNILGYTPMLLKKIGGLEFDRVTGPQKPRRWSRDELEEITEKYKKKLKELLNEKKVHG